MSMKRENSNIENTDCKEFERMMEYKWISMPCSQKMPEFRSE
jgi:hypothetical protein